MGVNESSNLSLPDGSTPEEQREIAIAEKALEAGEYLDVKLSELKGSRAGRRIDREWCSRLVGERAVYELKS